MHKAPAAKVTIPAPANISINTPRDPNTLSNYNNFKTTHTAVDLHVDFEKKLLHGTVSLTLKSLTEAETDELILDTRYVKLGSPASRSILKTGIGVVAMYSKNLKP